MKSGKSHIHITHVECINTLRNDCNLIRIQIESCIPEMSGESTFVSETAIAKSAFVGLQVAVHSHV